MKRLICLILFFTVSVLSFSGCAGGQTFTARKNKTDTFLIGKAEDLNITDEPTMVCENDYLRLFYSKKGITVENKAEDLRVWKSYIDETDYTDFAASTDTWKNYMQSIATVTYISKNSSNGNFSTEHSSAHNNTVSIIKYSNGLEIKIDFAKSKISVTVEIALDADGLNIRIPADKIEENGEFYLYSVEVLPFLNAGCEGDEGYIFYPDGCGALSLFDKTNEKSKFAQPLTLDIYSAEESKNYFASDNNPVAMLPVYGIKNGDIAVLAAITSGDSDAQINVNPAVSMSALAINRASFSLIFRRKYTVELAQIKSSKTKNKSAVKLKDELLDYDRTVKYFLLSDESADYSGMANAYRGYLLNQSILDGETNYDSKTVLKFFMGTASNGDTYQSTVKATGFSDVEEILSSYSESGITNITAILRGWQTGGYGDNLTNYNAENSFGGKKQLNSLISYIKENKSLRLLLEVDPMLVLSGTGFFVKGKNTISDGAGSPVTDALKEKYISNQNTIKKNFNKALNKIDVNDSVNILARGLGESIFSNLSDSDYFERYETQQLFEDLLRKSGKNTGVSGGNLYTLKYSDFLDESPQGTSDSLIEDTKIPWYQMVLHGSVSYTTKTGNSSYDLNLQKLKWIEYGAIPYFEITKENPSVLRDTDYTELFSSENSEWEEEIKEIYKEFEAELSGVTDGFIVGHKTIDKGIVSVRYDNNYSVIINYTDKEYTVAGYTVSPMDYAVIKE